LDKLCSGQSFRLVLFAELFFGVVHPIYSNRMILPEQIAVRYTEEDAGFVSVRPVVTQTFRLHELADLVVSAVGKDAQVVQKIFANGKVSYNGYRYWWDGILAELGEIEALLAKFPDDDPSRVFDPSTAVAAVFEIGGGVQRTVVEITRKDASEKKFFGKITPWDLLLQKVSPFPARYENYSHARKADLFRISLPYENAQELVRSMREAAPGSLRRRWSALRPPAAVTIVIPR
jgi:hypothetical protein